MTPLIKTGKKRTILISISILLISLYTIFFYQSVLPEINTKKLVQQIIRFGLTAGLLFAVYIGKNWARTIVLILFPLGLIMALLAMVSVDSDLVSKIPLFVMVFVYGLAIHHFAFSASFKAFFEYRRQGDRAGRKGP